MEKTTNINDVKARLAAVGFKGETKAVGLNIFPMGTDESLILKVTGSLTPFTKKDGKVMTFLPVINIETGEEGNIWSGGQLTYQLNQVKDGYLNKTFVVTYKGLMDVDGEDMHQYDLREVLN